MNSEDLCAVCDHLRWQHKEVDGKQVCTEYVNCACEGVFVEPANPFLDRALRKCSQLEGILRMLASQVDMALAELRNIKRHLEGSVEQPDSPKKES